MTDKTKCSCGSPKEAWQDCCKSCYAKKMNGSKKKDTKDNNDIRRQVFLKVAGNQLQNKTAKDVINYAKQLETEYSAWL